MGVGVKGKPETPKVREVEKWNQKHLVTASRETSRHSCSQWVEWHSMWPTLFASLTFLLAPLLLSHLDRLS